MSLQFFLTTLLVIVQSAMVLGNDIGHFQYNETNVLSSYYYYRSSNDTALIVFLCLWGIGSGLCLLFGCIMLCICKPKTTPGRILRSNAVEEGSEVRQAPSGTVQFQAPSSTGQIQPPSYQASQQQPLYPVYQPGMHQQKSGVNIEFQNPLGYTVKPGRIVGTTQVNDKQPQSSTVQPSYPTGQLPNASYPASEQQFINPETPSVIGTQNTVTDFHNPMN